MLLDLLRHADAGDPMAWDGPDARRPLSDKGRKQSQRLGDHLASIGYEVNAILASPMLRAEQTADLVADRIGANVELDDRLAAALDLETVDAIIDDAGGADRVLLVGHDPDFSELVAVLCGAAGVTLRKGAFARIEVDRPLVAGAGMLKWLIPPDALKPSR